LPKFSEKLLAFSVFIVGTLLFAEDVEKIDIDKAPPQGPDGKTETAEKIFSYCYTINKKDFIVDSKTQKRYPFLKKTLLLTTFYYLKDNLKCKPIIGTVGPHRVKAKAVDINGQVWIELNVINYTSSKMGKGNIVGGIESFKGESPILILDRTLNKINKYLISDWYKDEGEVEKVNVDAIQLNFQGKDSGSNVKVENAELKYLSDQSKISVDFSEDPEVSMPYHPFVSAQLNKYKGIMEFSFQYLNKKHKVALDLGMFPSDNSAYTNVLPVFMDYDFTSKSTGGSDDGGKVLTSMVKCVGVSFDDFTVADSANKAYPFLKATLAGSVYLYLKENLNCKVPTNGFATHKITGAAYVTKGKLRVEFGIVAYDSKYFAQENVLNYEEKYVGQSPLLMIDQLMQKVEKDYIPQKYKKSKGEKAQVSINDVQLYLRVKIKNLGQEIYPIINYVKIENVNDPTIQEELYLKKAYGIKGVTKLFTSAKYMSYQGFNNFSLNILDPEHTKINLVLGKFANNPSASKSTLPVFVDFSYEDSNKWQFPYMKADEVAEEKEEEKTKVIYKESESDEEELEPVPTPNNPPPEEETTPSADKTSDGLPNDYIVN